MKRSLIILGAVLCLVGPGAAWWALAQEAPPPSPLTGGDLTAMMVKMVAALALVLGLMLGLYWVLRRFVPGGGGGGSLAAGGLRQVGRLALGPKKSLVLVEMGSRILVLGVGEQEINLLYSVDDPEEVARLAAPRPGFSRFLKRAEDAPAPPSGGNS
ncbi:MAG: flagellar biosynthetic protein FliO [Deltaproteobacteria bacterium]|nr:flagellar biosynthetic protein FliO [Deltaproteobacteria bacterium]